MIKSLITEYGLTWFVNRSLYSAKLKMMRFVPFTEKIFEKNINIKRINILDVDTKKIEEFLRNIEDKKKKEIIKIADRAVEGKIRAFSSIELDYGYPINWNYNPITKVKVDKNQKWYKIPDFDSNRGDIKAIWEASRFTHFFYFTRAYLITKDIKYYTAFSKQLKNWLENNQYSYGSNYKCGQEATLRMINALIAFSVFKERGLDCQEDENNLKKLIEGSYKKILSNFFYAHKCIKNNHTLSEITGLIIGAWCSEDETKLNKAYRLLNKEIRNQFLADGGYIQYSFNYQRFALQIMEIVLKLGNKTKRSLSRTSKELIKNSVLLMYQMQNDDGDMPNYGSNDGALIFPVTSCGYRDFKPVLNTIYLLLEGKKLYEAGDYDEELFWFFEEQFDKSTYADIKRVSSEYRESGFYSLRHKEGYMMTAFQNYKTRPAQMDQLHIDLWHKGKNILCDIGTYSYATDIGKEMALTAAHNTVKIDDKEQMKKHGSFFIYDWSKAKNVEFSEDCFRGTMISKNGYSHTRSIQMIENGYLIEDIVEGKGEQCEIYIHTPCDVRTVEDGFELIEDNKVLVKVVTEEKIEIRCAQRSLYYLKTDKINLIVIYKDIVKKYCKVNFEIQLI